MFTARRLITASILSAVAGTVAAPAQAATVTATLLAQYFEVARTSDADFAGGPGFNGSQPVVADGSALGPNGQPVGTGVNDIVNGQIAWWNSALNPNVVSTGSGAVVLSYNSNMYAPNSTGTSDSSSYETAVLTGSFALASASTVGFNLGSDDDAFIYVDGVLFGQNPGIHGVTTIDFTTPTLAAGNHTLSVFYADRESTGAFLSLSLDAASSGVVITPPSVPEPATWALMVGGFGLVGGALRRRQASVGFG